VVSFRVPPQCEGEEGEGGGSRVSAFCTTRFKVSQNCCESKVSATQSTWLAVKGIFLLEVIT